MIIINSSQIFSFSTSYVKQIRIRRLGTHWGSSRYRIAFSSTLPFQLFSPYYRYCYKQTSMPMVRNWLLILRKHSLDLSSQSSRQKEKHDCQQRLILNSSVQTWLDLRRSLIWGRWYQVWLKILLAHCSEWNYECQGLRLCYHRY